MAHREHRDEDAPERRGETSVTAGYDFGRGEGTPTPPTSPLSDETPRLPDTGQRDDLDPSDPPLRDWGPGWTDGRFTTGQVLLGKYQVVEKIGQGGMGAVWRVRHTALDDDRALKVIVSNVAFDSRMRARFRREARAMARLKHPNTVAVHDADARPNSEVAFIEMDFVEGWSLKSLMEPGVPMPLDWIGRILDQLCDVLQVAHDHKIVHRDLKPANLMLAAGRPKGQELLKVLDFGIAKILESEGVDPDEALTLQGHVLGTPQYMSPEQVAGDPGDIDARSDLYAVGLILYEMLTGYRPFEGGYHRLCADQLHAPPPPFAKRNPQAKVPAGVEKLVLKCLEKDPERRPQSAREVAEEFRRLTRPRPRRRRWRILVPALLLILACLAMGWAWFLRPKRPALRVLTPPLTLRAGDPTGAVVTVLAPGLSAPEAEPPEGLKIAEVLASTQPDYWQFRVTPDPDPNTPPGKRLLTFRGRADGKSVTATLPVTIETPRLDLPPLNFHSPRDDLPPITGRFVRPDDSPLRLVEGKTCPERIERVLPDGTRVAFLLIPREPDQPGPGSYYIMEDKVWDGLYRAMLQARDESSGSEADADRARLPVTNVTPMDAHRFALWLGGPDAHLPTREQWDKAAGLYDERWNLRHGPIALGWDPEQPGSVAVGREDLAPVGSSPGDRSLFGCRDMAGNCLEWTSEWKDGRTLPAEPSDPYAAIYLRGREYNQKTPLTLDELADPSASFPRPNPMIGFRVVIEVRRGN